MLMATESRRESQPSINGKGATSVVLPNPLGRGEQSMFKVVSGLLAVAGIWVGLEVMTEGPSQAFGGAFKSFVSTSEEEVVDTRRTSQRAGDSVARARDEAEARRERMLSQ